MNFECHITTTVASAEKAEVVASELGWKTSEIRRDPVLGDASHFYLTMHGSVYTRVHDAMRLAATNLRNSGCVVLREKIELIMYDTKTGVGM
jgi:hypothetical protein